MKTLLFSLLLISSAALADVKISQLPLGSAASTNVNDSFPYVSTTAGATQRLKLSDLINLPQVVATYAPIASPTFTGTVTAPTIVLSSGATVGYCWEATSTGGAGAWSACSTFVNPMTTLGDLIYGGASGAATRLAGNTTATKEFLTQTGTGSASAAPAWGTISASDVPTLNQNTTGSAGSLTQSLTSGEPVIGNGTGITVGTKSGNTTEFASVTGSLTSGDCLQADANGNVETTGSACGSAGGGVTTVGTYNSQTSNANGAVISGSDIYFQPFTSSNPGMAPASGGGTTNFLRADGTWAAPGGSGSGTVNSGTAGQMGYYASTGTAISGNANATISSGNLTLGVAGTAAGTITLSGSTSGTFAQNACSNGTDPGITWPCSRATGMLWNNGSGVGSWTASPTLTGLNISGLTASEAVVTDASKNLASLPYSTTPAASTLSEWDANSNLSANNFIAGYTTTVTASGTTTLTVSSARKQVFTGTSPQTVVLPAVSTLAQGTDFIIQNNSTGILTIESSGGNVITTMAYLQELPFTSNATTGTGASVWDFPSISGQVAQAQLYAQVVVSGCSWSQTNSGMVDFPAATGCTYTFTSGLPGNCSAPATNLPGMKCSSLPPGAFKMVYNGGATSLDGYSASFQLYDGTNFSPTLATCTTAGVASLNLTCPGLDQDIVYTTPQSNITLRYAAESSNTAEPAGLGAGTFSLYYYPTQSQQVASLSSVSANASYTSTMQGTTTATGMGDITGALSGTIAVAGTPHNITCTADGALLGIDCTLPRVGNYQVCFSGYDYNTTAGAQTVVQLTDGAGTVIVGQQHGPDVAGSSAIPAGGCGGYSATSTSVVFKLQGLSSVAGTAGFRPQSFSVTQLDSPGPQPYATGNVTSSGSGQYHVFSGVLTPSSGTSCTLSGSNTSWAGATTPNAAGDCTVAINTGVCSSPPECGIGLVSTSANTSYLYDSYIDSVGSNFLRIKEGYIASGSTTVAAATNAVHFVCSCPH